MRNWKWLLILALLAGLVLTLAACGGDDAQPTEEEGDRVSEIDTEEEPADEPTQVLEEPTQEPTEEPTEAVPEEPTEEPTEVAEPEPTELEAEEELDLGFLDSMADYTSFRSRMLITVEGIQDGEPFVQSIEMIMEVTTDPPAQHMSMSGDMLGEDAGTEGIDMYLVEDTMYMQMGGEWMSVPAGAETPIDEDMFSPESFIGDSCGWQKQGDTEVLGVPVHHWTADKDSLEDCATQEMLEDMGEIHEFSADVYVAVDGGYMVQMDIYYEGEGVGLGLVEEGDEPLEEASLTIHFEYTDVNVPFTIEAPEEALAGGNLPEDIPMPPDSGNVTSALGMIIFETSLSGQEAYDFYLDQMPTNGWTQDSADAMGTTFMMAFSKDTRSASFMISEDEDSGVTSVMITISEE